MTKIILSLAVGAALAASGAEARSISQLFVFGDSNVDIGRLSAELAGNPNDGAVVPPSTVAGRSSDGPLIVEYLAETLRVPQLNFAWGGATSGPTNIVGVLVPGAPDTLMTGQSSQLMEFETYLGGAPADPRGLYILWAGSNDLFFPDKTDQDAIDAAVAGVEANLTAAAQKLSDLGARDIVIANRTPRPFLSDAGTPSDEPEGVRKNDAAGRQLNAAMAALVPTLDAALPATVSLFDDYGLIRDIIANSGANGFTAYSPLPDQYCINNDDCSTLINYDGAHKTSAVHRVLAQDFIDQFGLVPVPLPAGAPLYLGALALSALVLRRRAA